jgi:hypothetical protein
MLADAMLNECSRTKLYRRRYERPFPDFVLMCFTIARQLASASAVAAPRPAHTATAYHRAREEPQAGQFHASQISRRSSDKAFMRRFRSPPANTPRWLRRAGAERSRPAWHRTQVSTRGRPSRAGAIGPAHSTHPYPPSFNRSSAEYSGSRARSSSRAARPMCLLALA